MLTYAMLTYANVQQAGAVRRLSLKYEAGITSRPGAQGARRRCVNWQSEREGGRERERERERESDVRMFISHANLHIQSNRHITSAPHDAPAGYDDESEGEEEEKDEDEDEDEENGDQHFEDDQEVGHIPPVVRACDEPTTLVSGNVGDGLKTRLEEKVCFLVKRTKTGGRASRKRARRQRRKWRTKTVRKSKRQTRPRRRCTSCSPPNKQCAAVCARKELVAPNTNEHSNSDTSGAEAVEETTRPRTPLEVRILRTSMVSYLLPVAACGFHFVLASIYYE